MATTTLLVLDQKLLETIGDWKQHLVTTNLAASLSVVSTHLPQYRSTADYFNGHWIYIEDKNNIGASRYVSDDDGTNTLTVLGANFSADTQAATFRLSRHKWENRLIAINQTLTEIHPAVYKEIDDQTLVAGNILPDPSFEEWSSSSAMSRYTGTNVTLAQTTTAGLYRGPKGTTSAKATVTAANGYFSISSNNYPRLLDLAGQSIDFKAWAYPEVADDANLVIYTLKADGTAQTLTSTTTCPAGKWTLLTLESQAINSGIVQIDFRFKVATDTKYAYFDSARVTGKSVSEYLLPTSFLDGTVSEVFLQRASSGQAYPLEACDDLDVFAWTPVTQWTVVSDGTDTFLSLPYYLPENYKLRVIGRKPFDQLSAATDTIATDTDAQLRLIATYAAYRLFYNASQDASGSNISLLANRANGYLGDYYRMAHMRQPMRPVRLNTPYY